MPGAAIGGIATALLADLDRMTAAMVEGYRRRIPEYTEFLERHQEDVFSVSRGAVGLFLKLIVEAREPSGPELALIRASGRTRAAQGLPLESMLQAYSIGREIAWEQISAAAEAGGV